MRVKCDGDGGSCKKFDLEQKDFKTERVRNDIERTFFLCPNCGKEYIGFYANCSPHERG